MRVRLTEDYGNWYWNSGTGVTIRKDDRNGVDVDIDNPPIRLALEQGILEIAKPEEKKIITDTPTMPTMKEVVTESNTVEMKKAKKKAKKGVEDDD